MVKKPFTSAQTLSLHIATLSRKKVTAQTISSVLDSIQFVGRTSRKKPFIDEINRQKHLEFAETYVDTSIEF